MPDDDLVDIEPVAVGPNDPQVVRARADLMAFVERHPERVFYSRQLEVIFENDYFHWITNRAIRELAGDGKLSHDTFHLPTGNSAHLLWHPRFRYYKRSAKRLLDLVAAFSENQFARLLGYSGEMLVLEAFARNRFELLQRNTREFDGRQWNLTGHDLDFVWRRNDLVYGVEVKNALGYMKEEELNVKLRICEHLQIRPVFVVRMMPKTWIHRVSQCGGFALILKYQLYPLSHVALARTVREELSLPVDAPHAIWDSTIARFVKWHDQCVN